LEPERFLARSIVPCGRHFDVDVCQVGQVSPSGQDAQHAALARQRTVLDVGTGRGLLLISAARRLTTGTATGIDVWSTKDLSGNSLERTQANIDIEGVRDKVDLKSDDARKLSFPDASFDVILSNLCVHNIPEAEGRAQACREIARVLKPGGTALISDFINTGAYQKIFASCGLKVSRTGINPLTFPWLRVVKAEKG
jgi:ubiquinone/menaquinone biosynthesis C-methylase UbiE